MLKTSVDPMTKKAALAATKDYQPCHAGKKKLVSIFSPWASRMVRVNPYSPKAKKLYRFYIEELGYDAAWIAPPDLAFHDGDAGQDRALRAVGTTSPFMSTVIKGSDMGLRAIDIGERASKIKSVGDAKGVYGDARKLYKQARP